MPRNLAAALLERVALRASLYTASLQIYLKDLDNCNPYTGVPEQFIDNSNFKAIISSNVKLFNIISNSSEVLFSLKSFLETL